MSPIPAIISHAPEDAGAMAENNSLVESLRSALLSGERAYRMVPPLLEEVLDEGAWLARRDQNGNFFGFDREAFVEFLTSPEPKGLGTTAEGMRQFLGDSSLRHRFERLVATGPGNPTGANQHRGNTNHVSNSTEVPTVSIPIRPTAPRETKAGNSIGYAVRRLGRHRPDMLAKVEAGELSAHAAMVAAGFTPKKITLPAEPIAAGRLLARHFTAEQFDDLVMAARDAYAADGTTRSDNLTSL